MNKGAFISFSTSYQRAKHKGTAQKLDQIFGHFAEDSNISKRWIWELIQNAKDVPNEFGKVKIRIIIKDNSLQFSHNGDPFKGSDLQSIVSQYSSKIEQNKAEVETTGKYGTGFISAYFISRLVTIRGIIKSSNEQGQQANQTKEVRMVPQKKIKIDPLQNSFTNQKNLKKIQQEQKYQKNIDERQMGRYFFSPFQIILDRNADNREELAVKLMENQKLILQTLSNIPQKNSWSRTENDYDTSFIYQDLKKSAFSSIKEGINSLRQLFPYALLFNSKLHQITVIDNRTQKKMQQLTITKEGNKKFGFLNVSVCRIKQGQKEKIVELAYKSEHLTNSIVCVPIKKEGDKINILKIQDSNPKIFKQFPLFGCQDVGFNFVFTSRNFYPNKSRSNLKLKLIEGRQKQNAHAKINMSIIKNILSAGLELYKILSIFTNDNIQNILAIRTCNLFAQSQSQFKKFVTYLLNCQIIPSQNGNRISLKQLKYIEHILSNGKIEQNLNISNHMNNLFRFLYKDVSISNQIHARLFKTMQLPIWKQHLEFIHLNQILKDLSSIGYKKLLYRFKSDEKAQKYLGQVYSFLYNYQLKQYISFNGSFSNISFVLTKKNELRSLNQLKSQEDIPFIYYQLCNCLGHQINKDLIHDNFRQFFYDVPKFTIKNIEEEFQNRFKLNKKSEYLQKYQIKLLLRFSKTLKIGEDITDLMSEVLDYADAQSFPVDMRDFKDLSNSLAYVEKLKHSFLNQVSKTWLNKPNLTLENISNKLMIKTENKQQFTLAWWTKLLKLENTASIYRTIKFSISTNYHIKEISQLRSMNTILTDQQIKFVNEMNAINNTRKNSKAIADIQDILVHPTIAKYTPCKQITQQEIYASALQNYKKKYLSNDQLQTFLDFYDNMLTQSKVKPTQMLKKRILLFKEVRNERHLKLMSILSFQPQQIDAIYHIVHKNKQDLQTIEQLLTKYSAKVIEAYMNEANK